MLMSHPNGSTNQFMTSDHFDTAAAQKHTKDGLLLRVGEIHGEGKVEAQSQAAAARSTFPTSTPRG
jgi:hypothetical protein